jgi:hypothetical protein
MREIMRDNECNSETNKQQKKPDLRNAKQDQRRVTSPQRLK